MMGLIQVDGRHREVIDLGKRAFPEYKGRKFSVSVVQGPLNCASYWSEGSRDYFRFVRLADGEVSAEVPAQSAFDRPIGGIDRVELPAGFVCVEHSFRGNRQWITVHVHPDNFVQALPRPAEVLSLQEKIVLYATRSLKSSYGGIPNYRHHEAQRATGISLGEYLTAKSSLMMKGFLNKAGALTVDGRNLASEFGFSWPKAESAAEVSNGL